MNGKEKIIPNLDEFEKHAYASMKHKYNYFLLPEDLLTLVEFVRKRLL